MRRQLLPCLLLILSLLTQTFAQNPAPSPAPPVQQPTETVAQEDTVRITTNLVQLDVVVVDSNNNPVTDLRPEEFEIKEDNRTQKITNFSYISAEPAATAGPASAATSPADKNGPTTAVAPALVPLRASQVKRTMALVVDDLSLSLESTAPVRKALKKFVDEQMQPGDLVAIIRTAGGMGVLQQFTNDKRQLYSAIESIRWTPTGRSTSTAVAPVEDKYNSNADLNELLEFRNETLSVGTFGTLSYIVRGLKELPGRKSIIFYSESFRITSAKGRNDRLLDAMRRVTDEANRASVIIYTQDASGLQPLNYTAADSAKPGANDISNLNVNTGGGGMGAYGGGSTLESAMARIAALSEQRNVEFETHTVLDFLAQQTGGTFSRFTNDLNTTIRNALADQRGYYLIGYRPDESTFDPKTGQRRFHKWEIKVKRPGLKVRYRNGFYGIPDEEKRAPERTREQQMMRALISPFAAGDIRVRLTSLFRDEASVGSYMNSLIYVDTRDLNFKETADGWREAVIDVIAMTFGDNGVLVDQFTRTQTIRVRGDTYQRFLQSGLAYNLSVPIKRPGAYQLRVGVRDATTDRLGSAGQFIEVPDLTKNRLALSGIVISSTDPKAQGAAQAAASSSGTDEFEQQIGSAVRRLRYGMLLDYGYVIYNAQLDKVTGKPQLQTQIRLMRDGQQVFAGRLNPFDTTGQTDMKRLIGGGRLQIGTEMAPGQYLLQITVTEALPKGKTRTATQWIDFEVVK
jgi:VWFA-related protein